MVCRVVGEAAVTDVNEMMPDCCRAAVVAELRAQAALLRKKGRADMRGGFAAGQLLTANQLDDDADALETRESVLVDGAEQPDV